MVRKKMIIITKSLAAGKTNASTRIPSAVVRKLSNLLMIFSHGSYFSLFGHEANAVLFNVGTTSDDGTTFAFRRI